MGSCNSLPEEDSALTIRIKKQLASYEAGAVGYLNSGENVGVFVFLLLCNK